MVSLLYRDHELTGVFNFDKVVALVTRQLLIWGGGGYSWQILVEVCRLILKIHTRFQIGLWTPYLYFVNLALMIYILIDCPSLLLLGVEKNILHIFQSFGHPH